MELEIITKDYQLTKSDQQMIKSRLVDKVDQLLADFSSEVKQAALRIKKGPRWGHQVSFNMHLPKQEHIFAETQAEELLQAVVDLRAEVIRQIKKYREKLGH